MLVLLARLLLAAVFGLAATAKLADPDGARRAISAYVPGTPAVQGREG